MDGTIDFAGIFDRLARDEGREETVGTGGVAIRLVRIAGGGAGQWDRHDHVAETVLVWAGSFSVEFPGRTLQLAAGQCCVVPAGVEHRGTSRDGAEIVLFQEAP